MAGEATLGQLGQSVTLGDQGDGRAALGDVADKEGRVRIEDVVGEAHDDELLVVVGHGPRARDECSLRVRGQVEVGVREGQEGHADSAGANVKGNVVLSGVGRVDLVL